MYKKNTLRLQLFAGEGTAQTGDAGGAPADNTGENAAEAGRQRLIREFGVPEGKLKQGRAYPLPEQADGSETGNGDGQEAAAQVHTGQERTLAAFLKESPGAQREMDELMRARLKTERLASQQLTQLAPVLHAVAAELGVDPKGYSVEALIQAVGQRQNTPPDPGEAGAVRHLQELERQGAELKKAYPAFELRAELRNPDFARLTSPGVGLSVEQAYFACHHRQIAEQQRREAADQAAVMAANAVRAGQQRPQENGTGSVAPSVTTFDYRKASAQQKAELKNRIRASAHGGPKVYPGQ